MVLPWRSCKSLKMVSLQDKSHSLLETEPAHNLASIDCFPSWTVCVFRGSAAPTRAPLRSEDEQRGELAQKNHSGSRSRIPKGNCCSDVFSSAGSGFETLEQYNGGWNR